jgi:hypothetical protein
MYQLRNSRVPSERAPACWVRRLVKTLLVLPDEFQDVEKVSERAKEFSTSKGTLRFSPDNPMPVALVKKLLKARIAENNARANKNRRNREQSQNFSRHKKGRVHPDCGWRTQTMES